MAADLGFEVPRYAVPLDRPVLYKWVPGNTDSANNLDTIAHSGGTTGRWKQVGILPGVTADKGTNLTDANQTLTWSNTTAWFAIPTATQTANRTKTLSASGVTAGARVEITRLDTTAFTTAIVNGGAGAGTIFTFPGGIQYWAMFYFDGTDWSLRAAGALEYLP